MGEGVDLLSQSLYFLFSQFCACTEGNFYLRTAMLREARALYRHSFWDFQRFKAPDPQERDKYVFPTGCILLLHTS